MKEAESKKMLNLFCYTGSVSIAAALAGFKTTSIDLSKTYLDWASKNFEINEIEKSNHQIIRADVLDWLKQDPIEKFDLIFFDPPTFSNSKKMEETFEVEKDHIWMIKSCMSRLEKDGLLYFSNNKRKFKIDDSLLNEFDIQDVSEKSIPPDFHDKKIHHLFKIRHKP